MKIHVNIDELVLSGFDPNTRHDIISSSLRLELAKLVHEKGLRNHRVGKYEISNVSARHTNNNLHLNTTQDPALVGRAIARSIYKAWNDSSRF